MTVTDKNNRVQNGRVIFYHDYLENPKKKKKPRSDWIVAELDKM